MSLFRRGEKEAGKQADVAHPLVGRAVFCRMCDKEQMFTRCWRRVSMQHQCPGCGTALPDPRAQYAKFQPACPHCGEYLEQPGFDYGLCDGCGSKWEIVEGTKPGLMPNRQQRIEMERLGKARSIE